ncbi:NTF2 domain-containing protein transpeptidase [Actinomadura craniellae]|uniref:NTF2 domain-containing protein transpeptidase n=1 Tax=Actinomadura craniellae TaxID=2231787 RepID=A0A365GZI2_9ACTN|nr:penicillin-binding transpeptidase domain-containing protein [Actinomadura craniellae]RAY12206.1 NTF2 domain-containing protein transpeptidase [Actinomadura craniellae]
MSALFRARRLRRLVAGATGGIALMSTATACFAEPSAMPAVRDFLVAWQVRNYEAAAKKTTGDPQQVAATLSAISDQLDAAAMKVGMGEIRKQGDTASARFSMKIDLGENGDPWTYFGQLRLRRTGGDWKVLWDPSVIHPNLKNGQRLAIVTEAPERAPVQDYAGSSLLRPVPAYVFGVTPANLADDQKTIKALAGQLQLDEERLLGRVRSAPPREFLPLVTLQQPDQAIAAERLRRIPGVEGRAVQTRIAPLAAAELVGQLGSATDDRLQQVGAPYQPGDTIGVTGIQLLFQRRLAGEPATKVVAIDPAGGPPQVLRQWEGQPSAPVRTTLNTPIQRKAERALSAVRGPASLTAVHASTGQVLAAANHLTEGRNLAFEGQYPPGMTFGIVSADVLLRAGQRANGSTDCPAEATVGGQRFANPVPARGKDTLQKNFAYSCTTTLATLSSKVSGPALLNAARQFGLGQSWGLPVPAYSGSVPAPANDAEKAALMIGEGRVRMSPLAMALVAGAAKSGTWRPPQLLSEPAIQSKLPAQPLDTTAFTDLRGLMRRSVHEGAARQANVGGGGAVHGVAATVRYTEGGRPRAVSWFVGFRDDIAFAIAVEGNMSNASVIANRFLARTPVPPR